MKKHLVLFIATLFLGFTSCSSDDDSAAPSVLGKWNFEKIEYQDANGQLLDTEEIQYDCPTNKVQTLDFKENGELDYIYYRTDCSERKFTIEWELRNGKVVFNMDGEFESIELTSSRLIMKAMADSESHVLLYLKR